MNLWRQSMQQLDAQPLRVRLLLVMMTMLLLALGSIQLIGSMSDDYRQQLWTLRMLPEQGKQARQALAEHLATGGNSKSGQLKQQLEVAARELDGLIYARLDAVRESEAGAEILQRAIESLLRNPGKLMSAEVKRMPVEPLLPDAIKVESGADAAEAAPLTKSSTEQPVDGQVETVTGKLKNEISAALAATADTNRLYKHGIKLTLRGAWFDLLELLEELEDVSPQLFWQSFDLHSDGYPYSTLTLTLFTVSAETI